MKKKGKFKLITNLFSTKDRSKLPINLYLLRGAENVNNKKNIIFTSSCNFYNTDEMRVGEYQKYISNIL